MTQNNVFDWQDNTYVHSTYTGAVLVFGENGGSGYSTDDFTGAKKVADKSGSDFLETKDVKNDLAGYARGSGDPTTTPTHPIKGVSGITSSKSTSHNVSATFSMFFILNMEPGRDRKSVV